MAEDRDEVHELLVLMQLETSWAEGLITSKETLEDTMVKLHELIRRYSSH